MAESITLQTSDNNVQQSDVLGRLSFAASNEANTSDARLVAASIHAEAEGDFTEISNPTSIVFSTANSESATSKLKINSGGHFIPVNDKTYDIGSASLKFRNIYCESNYSDKLILTSGAQPAVTTNTLYNLSGTLYYDNRVVALLPSGGLQNQILQKTSNTSYDLQWVDNFTTQVDVYVKNITGSGLLKGQAVYINGAQGDHPTITLAQATSDATSSKTLGLLKQDLADNEFGYVVSEGLLIGIDTDAAGSAGDPIWLSPSTPGGLLYGTANKPSAPDHMVFIGYVLRKQQNNGSIYVNPQNGFELDELHNVRIKSLSDNDILTYNNSSGVWANTTNPSGSLHNATITVSGMFVSGSGALNNSISTASTNITTVSGMFVSGSGALNNGITTVSGMFVSGSGALDNRISNHTHTTSQITDFSSSVSGLFSKTMSVFTASDNMPPASNFATLDTRNSVLVLEFDSATDEAATFIGYVPDSAILSSGLKTRISWMADTSTSGNVRWGVQFEADGTDLDADSYDAASLATSTTNGTVGIETIAEITSTGIDSLVAGDRYRLRVYRDADDAVNDTMPGDAQLISVEVRTV